VTDQDPGSFQELASRVDDHSNGSGNGQVPALEEPAAPELLEVSHAGDEPGYPRPPALVDGLLDAGDLLVLGAGRAVGKSWWGMDLADMLAAGAGQFMGAFNVQRPARVLYCHGELDDWGAHDRWRKLAGAGTPDNLVETFTPWRVRVTHRRIHRQLGPDSVTDEVLEAIVDPRLEDTIAANQVEVLILDPWAFFYGGKENSNDEVEVALAQLRALQTRHGLTVVILHHFGKGGADLMREPEDLWRGAGVLADRAHTRVTLTPLYTPRQAEDQGLDRHQARRYARAWFLRRRHIPPADMAIRWDVETGRWEQFKSTIVDPAAAVDRAGLSVTDMLQRIPDDGWPSVRKAAAALEVSRATAEKVLDRAVAQGFLEEYRGPKGATGYRRPTSPTVVDEPLSVSGHATGHPLLATLPPDQSPDDA
jgi:hypothetical protein